MRKAIVVYTILRIIISGLAVYAVRIDSPKEVPALEYNGVKYIVDHGKMGWVEAWDIKTSQKLWDKKVYQVEFDPYLESDAQYVFITSLKIENDRLIVTNEMKGTYTLDPLTGNLIENSGPLVYSQSQDRTNTALAYLAFGLAILALAVWLLIKRRKYFIISSAIIAILFAIFVIVMMIVEMIDRKLYSEIPSMTIGYFIEFTVCHVLFIIIPLLLILISLLVIFNIKLEKPLRVLLAIASILIALITMATPILYLFLTVTLGNFDLSTIVMFIVCCLGCIAITITLGTYIRRALKPAERERSPAGEASPKAGSPAPSGKEEIEKTK